MSGRNPFSSREIEQLVIYIAQYNPVPAGRLGNNLYKSLVDDVSTHIMNPRLRSNVSVARETSVGQRPYLAILARILQEKSG